MIPPTTHRQDTTMSKPRASGDDPYPHLSNIDLDR